MGLVYNILVAGAAVPSLSESVARSDLTAHGGARAAQFGLTAPLKTLPWPFPGRIFPPPIFIA